MLGWTLVFAVLALVAGAFGFFALAGLAASIAKILFLVFVVLLVLSFVMRALRGQSVAWRPTAPDPRIRAHDRWAAPRPAHRRGCGTPPSLAGRRRPVVPA